MKQIPLGKNCYACGKERKSRVLVYDPHTLYAYCDNPYVCNQDHPNSPHNILQNQKETILVSYAEANAAHKKQLLQSFDAEIVAKIQTVLQKPITLRIHDPAMAQFVIEYQEISDLSTTSDVFRYAIEQLMKSHNIALLREEKEQEPEAEKEPEPTPEPEPEKTKANDEWTF